MVSTVVTGGCVSIIYELLISCHLCGCKPEFRSNESSIVPDTYSFFCPHDEDHALLVGRTILEAVVAWYNFNREPFSDKAVIVDAKKGVVEFEPEIDKILKAFCKEENMAAPRGFSGYTHNDNWKHRSATMKCSTCMWYAPKVLNVESDTSSTVGRCRRHAPSMNGFPVVYVDDWCGDHKLDEEKV